MGNRIFSKARFFLATVLVLCFLSLAHATTYQELEAIYDSELSTATHAIIDGKSVHVTPLQDTPEMVEIMIEGKVLGTVYAGDRDAILMIIANALGIPLTSAGSFIEPISAAATTSRLVFTELVVPTTITMTEKNRLAAQKAQGGVRTFGGSIRSEWVDRGMGENGQVTGFNLGLAYDVENLTFGLIVPYDYFDFDSFTANRIGSIFYGQYHLGLTEELEATFTANLNYMFTDFRILGQDDDLSTYGGGLSAGLRYSQEAYELGCGVSYQYNQDDVDIEDDDQHLVKAGANVGFRVSPDHVVNVFGTWNYDVTDYTYDLEDDDYFEIGTEYRANFSDTWALNVGYRKVVDLEDYDSDMVYLGTTWQF